MQARPAPAPIPNRSQTCTFDGHLAAIAPGGEVTRVQLDLSFPTSGTTGGVLGEPASVIDHGAIGTGPGDPATRLGQGERRDPRRDPEDDDEDATEDPAPRHLDRQRLGAEREEYEPDHGEWERDKGDERLSEAQEARGDQDRA